MKSFYMWLAAILLFIVGSALMVPATPQDGGWGFEQNGLSYLLFTASVAIVLVNVFKLLKK